MYGLARLWISGLVGVWGLGGGSAGGDVCWHGTAQLGLGGGLRVVLCGQSLVHSSFICPRGRSMRPWSYTGP